MPEATPILTLTMESLPWDVVAQINVEEAGQTRPAKAGECQVQIRDVGEGVDPRVFNQTPWADTDSSGIARFNQSSYAWLMGWDGWAGANRMLIVARMKADINNWTDKYFWLGKASWTDPPAAAGHVVEEYTAAFPDGSDW